MNEYLKDVFPEPPMVAYRRHKNIRENLIRATAQRFLALDPASDLPSDPASEPASDPTSADTTS